MSPDGQEVAVSVCVDECSAREEGEPNKQRKQEENEHTSQSSILWCDWLLAGLSQNPVQVLR